MDQYSVNQGLCLCRVARSILEDEDIRHFVRGRTAPAPLNAEDGYCLLAPASTVSYGAAFGPAARHLVVVKGHKGPK